MSSQNHFTAVIRKIETRKTEAEAYWKLHHRTIREHPDGPEIQTFTRKLHHLSILQSHLKQLIKNQ